MISNSDGLNLKKYIDSNSGQPITIDYNGIEQSIAAYSSANGISPAIAVNQLASYSSFGPTPEGLIKPDLVAIGGVDPSYIPASGMYMAVQSYDPAPDIDYESLFSSNRYAAADGTSFSTPLVAGAAALVKQAHPNLTPAQIKSAVVNSASQSITTDDFADPVDVEWMGAGQLDANAAVSATVSVSPATASFGYATAGGAVPAAQTFTVTNFGSSSVTLAVSVAANAAVSGGTATITASPSSIALAAGASATLTVSVTGKVPAAGEYSGMVVLAGSGVTERIPYMLLVGDGLVSFANVNPLYSEVGGFTGQDGGPLVVQIIDEYGVPIANSPVTFSLPSRGSCDTRKLWKRRTCLHAGQFHIVGNVQHRSIRFRLYGGDSWIGRRVPRLSTLRPLDRLSRARLSSRRSRPQPTITRGRRTKRCDVPGQDSSGILHCDQRNQSAGYDRPQQLRHL